MQSRLVAFLAAALAAAPAAADYYTFTGTLSFVESSPFFLPGGVGVSGSGVAFSSRTLTSNTIRTFAGVSGFTGTSTSVVGSTAGYTQAAFIDGVGDGSFGQSSPIDGLHGKMAVRGLARRSFIGNPYAAFPLTIDGTAGLGLGGTVPATSGQTPSVRFGTWTTGTVIEAGVITQSHPAMGTFVIGNISGMGFDTRTVSGMGDVQLVTPVRTVGISPARGAVASLTLHFAPEPGRGLMLLAGSLALLLLGWRRANRAFNA
jgi:hypothetical protein